MPPPRVPHVTKLVTAVACLSCNLNLISVPKELVPLDLISDAGTPKNHVTVSINQLK